jgi:hypothetical protein
MEVFAFIVASTVVSKAQFGIGASVGLLCCSCNYCTHEQGTYQQQKFLRPLSVGTISGMVITQGRPKKKITRSAYLELRLTEAEKSAFNNAAAIAGISTSTWVRERIRRAAARELEEAGLPIPFLRDDLLSEA